MEIILISFSTKPQRAAAETRGVTHNDSRAIPGDDAADPDPIRDHASEATDATAACAYHVTAALAASRQHAHHEAAAHYQHAERYASHLGRRARAELLESQAHERYLTDATAHAIELRRQAADVWHALGDRVRHGDALRWLSHLSWLAGRADDTSHHARRAIEVLEPDGNRRELAAAYAHQAQLHMHAGEVSLASGWARKAITRARQLGDRETESHARSALGAALAAADDPRGLRQLECGLAIARDSQSDDAIARALTNLATVLVTTRQLPRATLVLTDALAYTSARHLDTWHLYLRGYQAVALLHAGRLADAVETSQLLLARPDLALVSRIQPLTVLGRARARRGDRDVWPALDEALVLAQQTGELQRLAPIRIARGEAAWLAGDTQRACSELHAALPLALYTRTPWLAGELMFVLALTGEPTQPPLWLAPPFCFYLHHEYTAATTAWSALSCPYERAWSLAGDDSVAGLRAAFHALERLGMPTAAARAAARLRALGVRRIPRRQRATTCANIAGLTTRQVEVLALVAEGLTNAEIGTRLLISPKAVEQHVSAILGKLDVENRTDAAHWYRNHGVGGPAKSL